MKNVVLKALDAIRDHKRSIENEIEELESEKGTLEQARDTLLAAPRTKAEVMADFERLVDLHREEYAQRLLTRIGAVGLAAKWQRCDFRLNPPATELQFPSMNLLAIPATNADSRADHDTVTRLCLVGLLGEPIKQSLRDMIERLEWPAGAIPQAERTERLADIDMRLARIGERLAELFSGAREAGISLFDANKAPSPYDVGLHGKR